MASKSRRNGQETPVEEKLAAARHIAKALRDDLDMTQDRAAIEAGVLPRTFWTWMHSETPNNQEFQAIVLPALHEQAAANFARARGDVHGSEGKLTAWEKWTLERRYRTIYGDLAQVNRVEVTGKDGGAIETSSLSDADIDKRLAELAAKSTGRGGGDE